MTHHYARPQGSRNTYTQRNHTQYAPPPPPPPPPPPAAAAKRNTHSPTPPPPPPAEKAPNKQTQKSTAGPAASTNATTNVQTNQQNNGEEIQKDMARDTGVFQGNFYENLQKSVLEGIQREKMNPAPRPTRRGKGHGKRNSEIHKSSETKAEAPARGKGQSVQKAGSTATALESQADYVAFAPPISKKDHIAGRMLPDHHDFIIKEVPLWSIQELNKEYQNDEEIKITVKDKVLQDIQRKRNRTRENQEKIQPSLDNIDLEDRDKVCNPYESGEPLIWGFNQEILQFYNYVCPTQTEQEVRQRLFLAVKKIASELFPESTTQAFGSFTTNLYLPTSDIDIYIHTKGANLLVPNDSNRDDKTRIVKKLGQLANMLTKSGLVHIKDSVAEIEVISGAKVPICKFRDAFAQISIDITMDTHGGQETGNAINNLLRRYGEGGKALIMLVKQFLLIRNLNETFQGGLGSFSVTCMVCFFLENHPQMQTGKCPLLYNLGYFFIEFLQTFGVGMDINKVGISKHGFLPHTSDYLDEEWRRKSAAHRWGRPFRASISIEDPIDRYNDLGAASFRWFEVQKHFHAAYRLLTEAIYHFTSTKQIPVSLLTIVLDIPGSVLQARNLLRERVEYMTENNITSESIEPDIYHNSPLYTGGQKKKQKMSLDISDSDFQYVEGTESDDSASARLTLALNTAE